MPVIPSSFAAPPWLRNGHVQTVLPVLLPRRRGALGRKEILELADGDFVELRWHEAGHKRLAILSHGLEGSAEAIYIRGLARTLIRAGWDVLAWNYRGCGGVTNRLLRSYHSGESDDLRQVVNHAHATGSYGQIALIGFSLGGNITLKYLGEAPPLAEIVAAVAVSAPVDLASSAKALDDRQGNRLYLRRFLKTLTAKMQAKSARFPGQLNVEGVQAIQTIREFDDRFTAPMHGFVDADDYWKRASSLPHLPAIRVPALLLNAQDDPLLAAPSFPTELASTSPHLHLETPAHGGHVGFLDVRLRPWHERRIVEFLNAHVCRV